MSSRVHGLASCAVDLSSLSQLYELADDSGALILKPSQGPDCVSTQRYRHGTGLLVSQTDLCSRNERRS
jgi:hypothetical protein